MSAILGITLAVWILWAVIFCLGLCAATARPIPKPASLRTRSTPSGQLTIHHGQVELTYQVVH